jgi:hypothetical protein
MSCSGSLHPLLPKTPPQTLSEDYSKRTDDTPFKNPRTVETSAAIKLNLFSDPVEKATVGYAQQAKDMECEAFGAITARRFLDELMPYNGKAMPSESLSETGGIKARGASEKDLTYKW